eukprot:COSAG06_NODE_8415_length_2181_cov_8.256964_1_plen_123_part_00
MTTGALPGGTDPVRRWSLQSAAPVLASGWVLLGDLSRIVPVSPQRFASAHASTADDGRDALVPAELAAPGGGLAFVVLGAAGEAVEATLVQPAQTVLVLAVVVPPSGHVAVACSAAGVCVQT